VHIRVFIIIKYLNKDLNNAHKNLQLRVLKWKKRNTKRANPIDHPSYMYTQHVLSPREFVHARDPRFRVAPDRTLIICQLAHSRLRTRDTSIYRATNISIHVVFAKAVLDLFILGRSLHRPRGWFIILGVASRCAGVDGVYMAVSQYRTWIVLIFPFVKIF